MGPRQHDQRRANLLDAAASLFAKKGVAATSIEDIIKRAGVAKGTFYHYFQDRSAMLEALRDCYSKRFAELAEAAMETCASRDWDERLTAWINAVVLELIATYPLHEAIFHGPHGCQHSKEAFVTSLASLLRKGTVDGTWSVEEPLITAAFMIHGLHGLLDEAIAAKADTVAVTMRVSQLLRRLVAPADPLEFRNREQ
jgi:AcrR family transcriptional regulator